MQGAFAAFGTLPVVIMRGSRFVVDDVGLIIQTSFTCVPVPSTVSQLDLEGSERRKDCPELCVAHLVHTIISRMQTIAPMSLA